MKDKSPSIKRYLKSGQNKGERHGRKRQWNKLTIKRVIFFADVLSCLEHQMKSDHEADALVRCV